MRTTKQFVLLELLKRKGRWVSGDDLAAQLNISRESIWKAIKSLKNKGNQILSRKNLGYKYVGNSNLDVDTINFYSGMKYEGNIFVFDEVTSTQEVAKQYLSTNTIEKAAIFIANSQSKGYGRRGRSFYSPSETGLYFSIILHNPTHEVLKISLLTTSTSVIIARVLEKYYPHKNFQLKWVNDIYLGSHKVGGIITEAVLDLESSSAGNFIIGVGLNLSTQTFPEDLHGTVAGIDSDIELDRNQLLAELIQELINNFENYTDSTLIEEYRKRSFLIGKHVTLRLGTKAIVGEVQQISDDGSIVIKEDSGELHSFESGEVVKVDWM